MFGLFAVERILGEPLGPERYDPIAPPEHRAEQQRRLLEELEATESDDRK